MQEAAHAVPAWVISPIAAVFAPSLPVHSSRLHCKFLSATTMPLQLACLLIPYITKTTKSFMQAEV